MGSIQVGKPTQQIIQQPIIQRAGIQSGRVISNINSADEALRNKALSSIAAQKKAYDDAVAKAKADVEDKNAEIDKYNTDLKSSYDKAVSDIKDMSISDYKKYYITIPENIRNLFETPEDLQKSVDDYIKSQPKQSDLLDKEIQKHQDNITNWYNQAEIYRQNLNNNSPEGVKANLDYVDEHINEENTKINGLTSAKFYADQGYDYQGLLEYASDLAGGAQERYAEGKLQQAQETKLIADYQKQGLQPVYKYPDSSNLKELVGFATPEQMKTPEFKTALSSFYTPIVSMNTPSTIKSTNLNQNVLSLGLSKQQMPIGEKLVYDNNGIVTGVESSYFGKTIPIDAYNSEVNRLMSVLPQEKYFNPNTQQLFSSNQNPIKELPAATNTPVKIFVDPKTGEPIKDISKYIKDNKIPIKKVNGEYSFDDFNNSLINYNPTYDLTSMPQIFKTYGQNSIFGQPLQSGMVQPITADDLATVGTAGAFFGLGGLADFGIVQGTAIGSQILFSKPIAQGTSTIINKIIPETNSGFGLSGVLPQIGRGALFLASTPVTGVAFGKELGTSVLNNPVETGKGFLNYAEKNPYELATMIGGGTLAESVKVAGRTLELPQEGGEPVKINIFGLETKGGRALPIISKTPEGIKLFGADVSKYISNIPEGSDIKIGSALETNLIQKGLNKLSTSEIPVEGTAMKFKISKGDFGSIGIEPNYKTGDYVKLYHGTTLENYNKIINEGLKLGKSSNYKEGFEEPFISTTIDKGIAKAYAGEKGKIIEINMPKNVFKNMWENMEAFQDPFSTGEKNIAFSKDIKPEFIKSIDENIKTTERAKELIPTAQNILRNTLRTKVNFIDISALNAATERLPKEGVKALLDIGKENQGILFGSKSRAVELAKDYIIGGEKFTLNKVPRDIEFRFDTLGDEGLKKVTEKTIERLRPLGKIKEGGTIFDLGSVREIKDTPFALEAKVGGKFKKIAEIKGKENVIEGEDVPEYVLGIKKVGKTMNVEGTTKTRLNEELRGVMQGTVRLTKREGEIDLFPPEKRIKDIGSVSVSARTLQMNKLFGGAKLAKNIEKFESLFPEELVREQVKKVTEEPEKVLLADFSKVGSKTSYPKTQPLFEFTYESPKTKQVSESPTLISPKSMSALSIVSLSPISTSPTKSTSSIKSVSVSDYLDIPSPSFSATKSSSASTSLSIIPKSPSPSPKSTSPYKLPSPFSPSPKSISPYDIYSSPKSVSPYKSPSPKSPSPYSPSPSPKSPSPFSPNRYKSDYDIARKNKNYDKLFKAFDVLLRSRGRILEVGKNLPYGKALKLGVSKSKSSLAQTFALRESGTTRESDISYRVPANLFTTPKLRKTMITPLTFVERRGKTLSERTEVKQIGFASKTSKRGKKIKWF